MDPSFPENPNIFNDQTHQTLLAHMLNDHPIITSEPLKDHSFIDPISQPSMSALSSSTSSSEGSDEFSDSVLKYINQVLMEEDMESKPCMFHDPLVLQETEKSLYNIIEGGNINPYGVSSSVSFSDSSSTCGPSQFVETRSSILRNPISENFVFQFPSSRESIRSSTNRFPNGNGMVGSYYGSEVMVPDVISQNELLLQFDRGVEEGSKFLPRGQLISAEDPGKKKTNDVGNSVAGNVVVTMQNASEGVCVGARGKKNHQREYIDLEDGRSNKQSAVYMDGDEEGELSSIFDNVTPCKPLEGRASEVGQNGAGDVQFDGIGNRMDLGKSRGNKKEIKDLRGRLILCAKAVSVDDRETAIVLLKQIMQHSSPSGDCAQRLAHCFANALAARLAGTGTQVYASLVSKRKSAADMLRIYQAYIAACPFMKMSMIFANHMILKVAEKADTLHIIDFGVLYGFQYPALIHCLSKRPGGPPKLRITGIELPLSGFRPEERVQETGHRLTKYCKRFNVPFEYYAIAKKWETVQFDDLKVQRNEVVAVNCLCRFKDLLDETVMLNNPRDTVLNLVRKLNPDIFVQTDVNGSYHAPFFVSRFREALFHFSATFDMFDSTLPPDDQMRLGFEKEFIGREVVNIVACEGAERTVRPETYKQWQIRIARAGFRLLPLDREVMKKIKDKVKTGYNADFVVDEDGCWMLQGWKGRIMFGSACWEPSKN